MYNFFGEETNIFRISAELGTLEWWISELMLNPLFLLISRLCLSRD